MKVLIISDTHKKNENYLAVIHKTAPLDMVIHCGDAEGSEYLIEEAVGCPVQIVLGNNDFFSELPREIDLELDGNKIWITHGHNYYVSMGSQLIKQEARSRGADIVMFGHTHRPVLEIENDLITVNPGSLSYPRQDGKRPSYIIMETEDQKKPAFTIHYL